MLKKIAIIAFSFVFLAGCTSDEPEGEISLEQEADLESPVDGLQEKTPWDSTGSQTILMTVEAKGNFDLEVIHEDGATAQITFSGEDVTCEMKPIGPFVVVGGGNSSDSISCNSKRPNTILEATVIGESTGHFLIIAR